MSPARTRPLSRFAELCLAILVALAPAAAAAEVPTSAPLLQPVLLDLEVNGQRSAEPVLLLQDSAGALYASAATLRQWRLRIPAVSPLRFQGENYYKISGIPGLDVALAPERQAVTLAAAPDLFERNVADFGAGRTLTMTPSGTGAFFNYDVFAELFRGEASVSGAFEAGLFTPAGVGVSNFALQGGAGDDRFVRLETSWTVDRPSSMTSMRLGDSISVAGPGAAPVRFGGVQFGRNFAVQPGFVTMPLPALEGSAALPSVVDVYVNNVLQGSREIGPGPFELTHLPIQSGGGQVQLVVRDLLGRQLVTEHSYYASSRLLRRGLHDFSFELGFLRDGFGRRSMDYGALMASTTQRYGVSDRLTVEAHAQATQRTQMASAGIVYSLFDLGLVSGSAAVSRSGGRTGTRLAGAYERRDRSFSFGLQAEYASSAFDFVGKPEALRIPRFSIHAFADTSIRGVTVGANLLHRDHRAGRPDETVAGVFANFRIGRLASVNLYGRRAVAGRRETIAGVHVAFALGGRRSAAASAELRRGASSARMSYQHDPPLGVGTGYRIAASAGETESVDVAVGHNAGFATFGVQLTHVDGASGARLSAAGSVGLVGGKLFAARSLGSSFAAVQVGRQPGVRVYADNQLIGRTGRDGMLIVPALRAFDRNVIRIEETDLPIEVQLPTSEIAVRPFARAGAVVRFDVRSERGVLMEVRLEDGSPLPAGAEIRVEGRGGSFVAVSGGQVYVPDLSGRARLVANWSGRRCDFAVAVPDDDDPQPFIDGLVCRSISYAARQD